VQEQLQVAHALRQPIRRRRHEGRVARACATDPVLAGAELPRLLVTAATAGQQLAVDLPDQAVGQRQFGLQAQESVLHRPDVVGDFPGIVRGDAGSLVEFEQQQVGQRGLRALDLRRQHRFLADVRVEKQARARQQRGQAVESTQGEVRPFVLALQRPRQIERGMGGSGCGTKARTASGPKCVVAMLPVGPRCMAMQGV
jgi:hypothetical protein